MNADDHITMKKAPKAIRPSKSAIDHELDKARDLFLLQKLPQSMRALKAILKRDPNNYWANELLGTVLSDTGNLKRARKYYDRAIALKPKQDSAYWAKANALVEDGHYKEAEYCATAALQLATAHRHPCVINLELIYDTLIDSLIGQEKRQEALVVARTACATIKSKLMQSKAKRLRQRIHYDTRGTAYCLKRKWNEALADFRRSCEMKLHSGDQDYPRLRIWFVRVRLRQTERADQELAEYSDKRKQDGPDEFLVKVMHFVLDKMSERELIASTFSSNQNENRDHRCVVWFYVGVKRLRDGDQNTAADSFRKCLDAGMINMPEYQFARAELKALQ